MKYSKRQSDAKLDALHAVGNLANAIKNETFFKYNFNKLETAIKIMYLELNQKSDESIHNPVDNIGSENLIYIIQNLVQSITFDLNNEEYWLKLLKEYYNN